MTNKNPQPFYHKIIPPTTTTILLLLLLQFTIPPPSPSTYHSLFLSLSLSSNATAARHLHSLTLRPHPAGSPANSLAASYVLRTLSSLSTPSRLSPYQTLLSYPIRRSLSLSPSPPLPFTLSQQTYPGDPYAAASADALPTFLAYSPSAAAAGPLVYANYGRAEDFSALKSAGVDVAGKVVIARYGEIYRGDIVRNAQLAGAVAAILYTDAKDVRGGGGRWFPDDRWMPPSGVQVGSLYRGLGDPTTPGWASVGECERVGVEEVAEKGLVPAIPSLPVSWRDGEVLLRTVGGRVAAEDWQGGEGAPVYRMGPGPGFVNLSYLVRENFGSGLCKVRIFDVEGLFLFQGNETLMRIENVIAVIEGMEEPDR